MLETKISGIPKQKHSYKINQCLHEKLRQMQAPKTKFLSSRKPELTQICVWLDYDVIISIRLFPGGQPLTPHRNPLRLYSPELPVMYYLRRRCICFVVTSFSSLLLHTFTWIAFSQLIFVTFSNGQSIIS